jgi:hypothetical protein
VHQFAPRRLSTTPNVSARILRSSSSERLRM